MAGRIVFITGGYDAMLDGIDQGRVGFPVRVRHIDHHDEGTAHEILTDIMAGQAAGTFSCGIRYKGKRVGYWLGCVAPDVLLPRYYGLFSPAGELIGWFSLVFTLTRPDLASLGLFIRDQWRDKGIGTAATLLAVARKDVLLARPIETLLIMTGFQNTRVIRIARKIGLADLGMVKDAGTGVVRHGYATSPLQLPGFQPPADPEVAINR